MAVPYPLPRFHSFVGRRHRTGPPRRSALADVSFKVLSDRVQAVLAMRDDGSGPALVFAVDPPTHSILTFE